MSEQDEEVLATTAWPDLSPVVNQGRRRGVRVTTAAAVALGLALGGGAVAGAATSSTGSSASAPASGIPSNHPPMGGSPPAAVGTVKSVGYGTFAITTQDGTTVTVNVGTSTTFVDASVTSPTIANVTVGAHVAVFGTDTANVVTATSVGIGQPPGGGQGRPGGAGPGGAGGRPGISPAAVGTVTSVGDDTFTITAQDETAVTVNVSSATTYRDAGVTSATMADVTVGEHLAVFGTDTSNVVTATSVAIGEPTAGGGGGPGGRSGTPPKAPASSSS
jgi:preprotein translocase subunit YajC